MFWTIVEDRFKSQGSKVTIASNIYCGRTTYDKVLKLPRVVYFIYRPYTGQHLWPNYGVKIFCNKYTCEVVDKLCDKCLLLPLDVLKGIKLNHVVWTLKLYLHGFVVHHHLKKIYHNIRIELFHMPTVFLTSIYQIKYIVISCSVLYRYNQNDENKVVVQMPRKSLWWCWILVVQICPTHYYLQRTFLSSMLVWKTGAIFMHIINH